MNLKGPDAGPAQARHGRLLMAFDLCASEKTRGDGKCAPGGKAGNASGSKRVWPEMRNRPTRGSAGAWAVLSRVSGLVRAPGTPTLATTLPPVS